MKKKSNLYLVIILKNLSNIDDILNYEKLLEEMSNINNIATTVQCYRKYINI